MSLFMLVCAEMIVAGLVLVAVGLIALQRRWSALAAVALGFGSAGICHAVALLTYESTPSILHATLVLFLGIVGMATGASLLAAAFYATTVDRIANWAEEMTDPEVAGRHRRPARRRPQHARRFAVRMPARSWATA